MPRSVRVAFFVLVILIAIPAATARAVTRMPVGFYDDPSFRWAADPNPTVNLKSAETAGSSVIHVLADWSQIAPTKPANPLNGNDPAYNLSDLDALSREAAVYGQELLVTITGTPKWANGGQTPNHPPTNLANLTNFTQMLAKRYNGSTKTEGIITHWSIWNEPNLQLFLTPQFNAAGKAVSPAEYVKLFDAGYKGLKAGNALSQVAAGETSNRGHNAPTDSVTNSVAPATFARDVSLINPKLPFVAWATHPYPTASIFGPTQKVAYPNVGLTTINKFGADLQTWFKRPVPLWITEYGEQTAPASKLVLPVSLAKQAADVKKALQLAQQSPYVQMFVWFIFRDSTAQTWFSGLEKTTGAKKPSYNAWKKQAASMIGVTTPIKAGKAFSVTVQVPKLSNFDKRGATIGIEYTIKLGGKKIGNGESAAKLTGTQSLTFTSGYKLLPAKTYAITVVATDKSGISQTIQVSGVTS